MKKTPESGHAINIANLKSMSTIITAAGAAYNPVKASIKLTALTTLLTAADAAMTDVLAKNTAYDSAVNARVIAFSTLKPLATRLISALKATDATPEKIADAMEYQRKIQGTRAKAIAKTEPAGPESNPSNPETDPPKPTVKTHSSSQQSFNQLIQHFAGLISVLTSEASYAPNETELKITTLSAKQADLIAKNNAVVTAQTAIDNARNARNLLIYAEPNGVVPCSNDIKAYIISAFGQNSNMHNQVRDLKFRGYKF